MCGDAAGNAVKMTGKKRDSNVLCTDGGELAVSPSKISRRVKMRDARAYAHGNSLASIAVESPQSRNRCLARERQRLQRISKTKSDEMLKTIAAQKANLFALETNEKR